MVGSKGGLWWKELERQSRISSMARSLLCCCHWGKTCPSKRVRARLWPTLCDPMDCSPPDSSIYGIFQARILEWVAFLQSLLPTQGLNLRLPCLLHWRADIFSFLSFLLFFFFNHWATREAQMRGLSWPCSWQHGGDFLGKTIQISFSLRSWKREVTSIADGWVGRKASIMTGEEAWIWQK